MASNNKHQKGNKVFKAAMYGSLAGAVMGLLFAPKSGQELRQDLAVQAQIMEAKAVDIREKAQTVWQNVDNKTHETIKTGKSWINKGKRWVNNLKILITEIRNGALDKD
ncbi:MAG: YtxH domain-containing protein [Desulfosporosinus sp.]|jgi:gas vesicle protein